MTSVVVPFAILLARTAAAASPADLPAWNDLSFRGFAQEILFGHGTQRTPRFDDYTKGSYHVDPKELVEKLPKEADLYKLRLQSLVVVGPFGPVWAYEVIAVLQTKDCVRGNYLVMPHARITVKRSGCISETVLNQWLASVRGVTPRTTKPMPAASRDEPCIVMAEYSDAEAKVRRSEFTCHAAEPPQQWELLEAALQSLTGQLELTYAGYPKIDEE